MKSCTCDTTSQLFESEGAAYADDHLVKLAVNDKTWTVLYECPSTGVLWKKCFPQSGEHGGGSPQFVRISKDEAKRAFPCYLVK